MSIISRRTGKAGHATTIINLNELCGKHSGLGVFHQTQMAAVGF